MLDKPVFKPVISPPQGVQEDIATLQVNVENINEISKLFLDEAEPEHRDKVAEEVADLNTKWQHVLNLSREQNARLREALEKSQTFLEGMLFDYLSSQAVTLFTFKEHLCAKSFGRCTVR